MRKELQAAAYFQIKSVGSSLDRLVLLCWTVAHVHMNATKQFIRPCFKDIDCALLATCQKKSKIMAE